MPPEEAAKKRKDGRPHEMRPLQRRGPRRHEHVFSRNPASLFSQTEGKEKTLDPLLDWIPDRVGDDRREKTAP